MRTGRNAGLFAAVALLAFVLCSREPAALANQSPATGDETTSTSILDADPRALAEALVYAVASEIRREWNVKCDAINFNIYDSDQAHSVQLTVTNSGACPFKLTLTKADGTTEDFTVPVGTPTTINRANVKKITVDCDGAAPNDCKASYTLKEDGAAAGDVEPAR
jgi:hypothetical protein